MDGLLYCEREREMAFKKRVLKLWDLVKQRGIKMGGAVGIQN